MPTTDNTAVIAGAFVTVIGAFLGIAKIMLNQATKDREADRAERLKLSDAIALMAENSSKVAQATTRGAKEAKERNGHLGELVSQGNEITAEILKEQKNTASILADSGGTQHVDKQVVDKQIIKEK